MILCQEGMFWCVFEFVFGIGAAILVLLVIATLMGFDFSQKDKE